jgi:hypothetical protein
VIAALDQVGAGDPVDAGDRAGLAAPRLDPRRGRALAAAVLAAVS